MPISMVDSPSEQVQPCAMGHLVELGLAIGGVSLWFRLGSASASLLMLSSCGPPEAVRVPMLPGAPAVDSTTSAQVKLHDSSADSVPHAVPEEPRSTADGAQRTKSQGISLSAYRGLLASGVDCNHNNRADSDDILSGRSADRDRNGTPDECDSLGMSGSVDDTTRTRLFLEVRPTHVRAGPISISYHVPEHAQMVDLAIYTAAGALVERFHHGIQPSGSYRFMWGGPATADSSYRAGYFVQLRVGQSVMTQRVETY